jgi:hypothetical protein
MSCGIYTGSPGVGGIQPPFLRLCGSSPQLAFGVRLVELAEPNRHVAANDDRTIASLDDDHLQAARVARRRDEPEPGKQFERVRVEVAGERQVA